MHFDGTRLLFSGKRTPDDDWNIYEMSIDGSGLRQITRGLGDCRDPSYQSDYYQISDENEAWRQITFVNIREGERSEFGSASGTSLHSCRLDGTQVNRLTFNLSSDRDPELTWDGRLVYASWQRRTLKHGVTGRVVLLGINVDGTDAGPVVVDAGRRVKHMPCATTDGLLVFVEADRVDWDGAGMLSCVSLRRPLHTYRPLTKPSDGLFHSPSALPDGAIVVSRRPADGIGSHALYRFDPTSGQIEPLVQEPNYHLLQAQAVAVRQQPDGRSSSINETDPNGKMYCLNVYTNDFKDPAWMPPGSVKKLRVIEGVPNRRTPGTVPSTDASAIQPARAGSWARFPSHRTVRFMSRFPRTRRSNCNCSTGMECRFAVAAGSGHGIISIRAALVVTRIQNSLPKTRWLMRWSNPRRRSAPRAVRAGPLISVEI